MRGEADCEDRRRESHVKWRPRSAVWKWLACAWSIWVAMQGGGEWEQQRGGPVSSSGRTRLHAAAEKEWEVTRVHNRTKMGVDRMLGGGESSSSGGNVVENHKKWVAAAAAAVMAMADMPAQGSSSRGGGVTKRSGNGTGGDCKTHG